MHLNECFNFCNMNIGPNNYKKFLKNKMDVWMGRKIEDAEYFNELVFPSSTNSSPLIIPNSEEPMGIRDQPYPGFQKKTFCYQTHYFSKIHS